MDRHYLRGILWRQGLACMAVLLPLVLLVGCGGGEEEEPPPEASPLWSGVMIGTYVCEESPTTLQIRIEGGTITVEDGGGRITDGTTGTVTADGVSGYKIELGSGPPVEGMFYTDAGAGYAILVIFDGAGSQSGLVAVLTNGSATSGTFSLLDMVGNWSGTAVRVGNKFEITGTSASTATFADSSGDLALSGSDGDGAFSSAAPAATLISTTHGFWRGSTLVAWSAESFDGLYAMSTDKTMVAAAFLLYDSTNFFGDCDTDIFSDLTKHKFAVWKRQ